MSILIDNEVDRLFSLAFGTEWVRAGLLSRTNEELKQIDGLASDNVDNALHQIAAIGNILGAGTSREMDVTRLGWLTAHLAEYANIVSFMAATARDLQDPEIRALNKRVVDISAS